MGKCPGSRGGRPPVSLGRRAPEHAAGHEAPGVELLCGPVPRPHAVLAAEEKRERLIEPAVREISETLLHRARELFEQSGLALAGAGEGNEQGMILLVRAAPLFIMQLPNFGPYVFQQVFLPAMSKSAPIVESSGVPGPNVSFFWSSLPHQSCSS